MDTLELESRGSSCWANIIITAACAQRHDQAVQLLMHFFQFHLFLQLHNIGFRWRPYRVECTGSLLTSEVKQRRARSVLGWGTAWEDLRVLSAFRLAFDAKGVFCEIDELIAGPSKHRYRCCPESNHSRMRNSRLQKLSKFKASGHGKKSVHTKTIDLLQSKRKDAKNKGQKWRKS